MGYDDPDDNQDFKAFAESWLGRNLVNLWITATIAAAVSGLYWAITNL